jgi:alpha-amylase
MLQIFESLVKSIGSGIAALALGLVLLMPELGLGNPWNGKVVLQAFWWDLQNDRYPQNWYTYLAKLAPRLRELGFDGIWIPPPAKGNSGGFSMGYDVFDHYDLGDKNQKGTLATRFGNKDELLRLIAVAHANGLEVYIDTVLNHAIGGNEDPSAPGDRFKKFRYIGFGGAELGRWPKEHQHFHPNSDHVCTTGDICEQKFGPDICYLDHEHGGGANGKFMRDQAREWVVWLKKQTGADGFRFDAVKHFPAFVVEDVLFNAMGPGIEYFCAGEFVVGKGETDPIDRWSEFTRQRCGTFDFSLRAALLEIVEARGFFDMGSLPKFQQSNRLKTIPFINNHDTFRGPRHDSNTSDELFPTIDPDDPRADVAYAAALAVDGSPVVFYEDLFVNFGQDPETGKIVHGFNADPETIQTRDYLVNLIWAHQKLNFKDGAYKVPFQGSQDLVILERAGKALIALNDNGVQRLSATVQTSFGPHMKLHDYSGSNADDVTTDSDGRVTISVPQMSYAVFGPAGITGGFSPPRKRTTQEFQLDDDLGDSQTSALGYGGKITSEDFRKAGSIWLARNTAVRVSVFTDGERHVEIRVHKPGDTGAKSTTSGNEAATGTASNTNPLVLEFMGDREGYHQLSARLTESGEASTRGYIKVEYEAPARSDKF